MKTIYLQNKDYERMKYEYTTIDEIMDVLAKCNIKIGAGAKIGTWAEIGTWAKIGEGVIYTDTLHVVADTLPELHHITYFVRGKQILGHEMDDDNLKWVVTLCGNCHQVIHNDKSHKWNPYNHNKTCA